MRKTISAILLSAILMNSIGYIAVFGLLRWRITHDVYELIEHHEQKEYTELILPLSILHNPNKDFTRINRTEFRYKGKMYDIVTQKISGNSVHFTVINDPNDERNYQRLAENTNLQTQTPLNTENGKSVLSDIIVKGLFAPLYSVKSAHFKSTLHQSHLSALQNLFLPDSPCLLVPVPPPKIS